MMSKAQILIHRYFDAAWEQGRKGIGYSDTQLPEHKELLLYVFDLEHRLAVAMDLLQQIHDCPVNWVESTFPKGGMNPNNPEHREQVVGTQHISCTRIYTIAAFLRQNIEHEKGEWWT